MSKTKTETVFSLGDLVSFQQEGFIYYGKITQVFPVAETVRISLASRVKPGFAPDGYVFAPDSNMRDPGVVCSIHLLEKREA